ncbi:PREDICTED: dnaJ protein homolog 1-like isoform X1 [Nicotiana attenuata]|uniref:Chaperone protein dnaj 3 n=1 Tax=Nicotiana attenuata TaxID=49451 RepID=A0A1J6ING8_NICAT|nr:PREDICTED: dnaJ protein homolog 1-like isoform X1 [Nicotiana attenuata]OIS99262.1 chaperone protein dnaj 3 [Nicotiana attenuata]
MGESTKSPISAAKYYGILGISKSASLPDICKAYKHLVKKWHPDRNTSNQAEAVDKFRSINEAYRVLSKKKRDEENLLKSDAIKTPRKSSDEDELQISSPTLLSRTTSRISPTVDFYTSMPCFSMSGASTPTTPGTPISDQTPNLFKVASKRNTAPIIFSQSTSRRKPQPIEKKLECTLEELCHGCVKKVMITRDVIATTGIIVKEEEVVTIKVRPGWKRGTKITFEGKGDERPGTLPADIVFSIDEKTHPLFKREGDDLVLGVEVPLVQALTGCIITVPLLGGDEMTMSFDQVIYPGFEKIIPGQGMPKPKEDSRRGDLILQFLVGFPLDLSQEQRFQVVSILEDCS